MDNIIPSSWFAHTHHKLSFFLNFILFMFIKSFSTTVENQLEGTS